MLPDPQMRPYRILQVHNEYYRGLGGEDTVLSLEHAMLRKYGHEVEQLIVSTSELTDASPLKLLAAGISTPWSIRGYYLVKRAIERFHPDIVHFHNTFPLLSPSVYWAANARGIALVQTLHNYRLVCANGLISRGGLPCEECIGRLPIAALRYGCYKDSIVATAPVVAMQVTHRVLPTLRTKIDAFISLTDFAKHKMSLGGIPAEKIYVKPNFIPRQERSIRKRDARTRQFVFVGRILHHKGLDLLLEAWMRSNHKTGRLVIIGDGAGKSELYAKYPESERISWLGSKDHDSTMEIIGNSDFLVTSSRVVEGLPMVIVEAFSAGTPVVAPDHGSFSEMVGDGKVGFLFRPRDVDSLVKILANALTIDDAEWARLSDCSVKKYNEQYTEEVNYRLLIDIYRRAIENASWSR